MKSLFGIVLPYFLRPKVVSIYRQMKSSNGFLDRFLTVQKKNLNSMPRCNVFRVVPFIDSQENGDETLKIIRSTWLDYVRMRPRKRSLYCTSVSPWGKRLRIASPKNKLDHGKPGELEISFLFEHWYNRILCRTTNAGNFGSLIKAFDSVITRSSFEVVPSREKPARFEPPRERRWPFTSIVAQ